MNHPRQPRNTPESVQRLVVTALAAGRVGTTAVAILNFAGTPAITGTKLSATTTAADGTIVSITERGIYLVELLLDQAAATTVNAGISLNAQPADLLATPAISIASLLTFVQTVNVASNSGGRVIAATAVVTDALANAAGGALIRAHATAAAAAAPAGLVIANCRLSVTRIADAI